MTRLIDIGIAPYLVASSLEAVSSDEQGALSRTEAQRLLAQAGDKEFKKADHKDPSRGAGYVDDQINANDLESDGKRVHFSLFPVEKRNQERHRALQQNRTNIDIDEFLDNRQISVFVRLPEIVEQPSPLTDQFQQPSS